MGLKLQAEVGLDSKAFTKGMKSIGESVASTVKSIALGAIGVYSLEKAYEATVETAKELVNESRRMGVPIEQLQVMRKAAAGAGIELDEVAHTLEKINEFRAEALKSGSPEAMLKQQQAAQLGITPQMLQNSSAQEILFGAIAQKVRSVNPQQIAAPLKDVLGKSFGAILPMLSTDMGALQKKMESLGMIMSADTAVDLKQLSSSINSIQNIFVNLLAPALVTFAKMILGILTSGGIFSKSLQNWGFWIAQFAGGQKTDASGHSIASRSAAANAALTHEQEAFKSAAAMGENPQNQRFQVRDSMLQFMKDKPEFSDFKGDGSTTLTDIQKYLANLRTPGLEVDKQAGDNQDKLVDGLKEALEELNHPKLPETSKPEFQAAAQMTKQRIAGQGDSAIKAGNFLGASRGLIGGAQARLEHHAAETAKNTAKIAQAVTNKQNALINKTFGLDKTTFTT